MQYEESITTINQTMQILNFKTPNSLKFKLQHLNDVYQTLLPHTIHKRGLLNVVGQGLKFIAGTMDNNDAEDIIKHFSTIEVNEHNLIFSSNQQIKINKQLSDKLENIIKHINLGQNVTMNKVNKLQLNVNKLEKELQETNIVRDISENIDILCNHIENIRETIMLSRLEILSKDILSLKEIKENNIDLEKSKHLKVNVAIYNEILLFIILVPKFSNNKFHKVHIEPVPNRQNLQIETPYEYVIVNNKEVYQAPEKPEYTVKNLKAITDSCIGNILNNKKLECNYEENMNEEIKQITQNIIITKNLNKTTLFHTCNQPNDIAIHKNNIIKFENCKLSINNIRFENKVTKYYEHFILPNPIKVIEIKTPKNLTLTTVHNNNIQNRQEIEEVRYQTHKTNWISTSMDVIIIITIILGIIYFKCHSNTTRIKMDVQAIPMTHQELSLKDEGVTDVFT